MSFNKAISIKNINKLYQVYNKPQDRLKQSIFRGRKTFYREFWALRDITFDVIEGETVGIVGRNGSGKSTLLQIIAGTLTPSLGEIDVNGRVAALLELGSGFNPDFTGKENVFMNGAILGVSRDEMEQRYQEIVEFADIGEFIDQPVKTYSSGMYIRLAFAVAINVDADILIVDEALSVGDVKFQLKCIEKMKQLKNRGCTILFVSHSGEQVKRFCNKAIWLDKGIIQKVGEASEVVNAYEDSLMIDHHKPENRENNSIAEKKQQQTIREDNQFAIITSVFSEKLCLNTFERLLIEVDYEIYQPEMKSLLVGVAIYGVDRKYIFGPNTYLDNVQVPYAIGTHKVTYEIPKLPLLAGSYYIDVGIFTDAGMVCLDYKTNVLSMQVNNEYFAEGLLHIDHNWKVVK